VAMANREDDELWRRGDHVQLDTHINPPVIGIEVEHRYVDLVGADASDLFFDASFAQVQGDLGIGGSEGTGDRWNPMWCVRAEVRDCQSPCNTVGDRTCR